MTSVATQAGSRQTVDGFELANGAASIDELHAFASGKGGVTESLDGDRRFVDLLERRFSSCRVQ